VLEQKLGTTPKAMKALSALAGLVHAGGRSPQSRARKRQRPVSAAARKRIAAAQRARWAEWKSAL
jgi:hypothetical protein